MHNLIVNGLKVTFMKNDQEIGIQLKLIDFDNISRKTFTNKDDAIRAIKQSLRGISEDKY